MYVVTGLSSVQLHQDRSYGMGSAGGVRGLVEGEGLW